MADVTEKFGDWIKEGFDLYKNNLGVLILASLIAFVLSGITLGILLGPMSAGLISIILKLQDGKQPAPQATDVFDGFQKFLPSFLFVLVWFGIIFVVSLILNLIPCLGQILAICLSLAAGAFLMFGLFLIVDKDVDFWSASMASFEKVKSNLWPFLGLSVVAGIIGNLGSLACGIGAFATIPIYFAIIAVVYRDSFGNEATSAQAPIQELKSPQSEPPQPPSGEDKPQEGQE